MLMNQVLYPILPVLRAFSLSRPTPNLTLIGGFTLTAGRSCPADLLDVTVPCAVNRQLT